MGADLRSKEAIRSLLEAFISSADRLSVKSIREPKRGLAPSPDFVAYVRDLRRRGDLWTILIEAKSRGEPFFLGPASDRLSAAIDQWIRLRSPNSKRDLVAGIIIAPLVSELGRRMLEQRRTNYLDLAGNGRLQLGDVFIERTGNRGDPRLERRGRRLFEGKSQTVVRALLCEPKREWTLSSLSKATGLSIGYAHAVARRLMDESFVALTPARRLAVARPDALLDAWAKARTLETDEAAPYFSFDRSVASLENKVDQAAETLKARYALTLGCGASRRVPFARYTEVQLYIRSNDLLRWVKALNLRPAETGANIVFRLAKDDGVFYGATRAGGATVACDPQLFVDLYNYPARGREAAEALRDRRLRYGGARP